MQQEVVNSHVKKYQDEIKHLQGQLSEISEKEDCNIQTTKALEQDLKTKLEELTESHKCEVRSLEQDKSKLQSCITRLTDEITDYEARLKRTITESNVMVSRFHVHKIQNIPECSFLTFQ